MASSFLGPESPRPYAVISEGYRNHLRIPVYGSTEKYDLGKEYDETFYNLLQKYTDLDTTDRFCYEFLVRLLQIYIYLLYIFVRFHSVIIHQMLSGPIRFHHCQSLPT
jgi:hypothetical protein